MLSSLLRRQLAIRRGDYDSKKGRENQRRAAKSERKKRVSPIRCRSVRTGLRLNLFTRFLARRSFKPPWRGPWSTHDIKLSAKSENRKEYSPEGRPRRKRWLPTPIALGAALPRKSIVEREREKKHAEIIFFFFLLEAMRFRVLRQPLPPSLGQWRQHTRSFL